VESLWDRLVDAYTNRKPIEELSEIDLEQLMKIIQIGKQLSDVILESKDMEVYKHQLASEVKEIYDTIKNYRGH
jgi:hypothetical protein